MLYIIDDSIEPLGIVLNYGINFHNINIKLPTSMQSSFLWPEEFLK